MVHHTDDQMPAVDFKTYAHNALCRILSNGRYWSLQVDYGGLEGWAAPYKATLLSNDLPVHVDADKLAKVHELIVGPHARFRETFAPYGAKIPNPGTILHSMIDDPNFVCELWPGAPAISENYGPGSGIVVYYVFWP